MGIEGWSYQREGHVEEPIFYTWGEKERIKAAGFETVPTVERVVFKLLSYVRSGREPLGYESTLKNDGSGAAAICFFRDEKDERPFFYLSFYGAGTVNYYSAVGVPPRWSDNDG